MVNSRIKALDEDIHETLRSSDVASKPLNLTVKPQNIEYIITRNRNFNPPISHNCFFDSNLEYIGRKFFSKLPLNLAKIDNIVQLNLELVYLVQYTWCPKPPGRPL